MTSIVACLFGVAHEEFVTTVWPTRPAFAPGTPARARELVAALMPAALRESATSPAAFLAAYTGRVWLNDTSEPGRYQHEQTIDAAAAAARFATGAMFDVRNIETWIPEVASWLAGLNEQLGLGAAARASYCHAFASPRSTGVPKHFDNREVIVVQLLGTKRWELMPNTTIANPLAPHVVGGVTNALNRHVGSSLDDHAMPLATTYVLEPGAALFVPRGMWHRTCALEDSLSFSFGLRVPSRLEEIIQHLVNHLASTPGWGSPAYDLATTHPEGSELTRRAIRKALDRLRAAALLGS